MNESEARKESRKASDRLVELLRRNGDEVAYEEPPCILWKAEHENCKGCSYQLGCNKVARLLTLVTTSAGYKPSSFADYLSMIQHMGEQRDKILSAKTLDELHLVSLV